MRVAKLCVMCSRTEREVGPVFHPSIASYPHVNNRRRQPLIIPTRSLLETKSEATMPDLQQPLLSHLQREAQNARERDRASVEENEQQIAASRQQTDESWALLQCLKKLNCEM
jgi:hypothetical protein